MSRVPSEAVGEKTNYTLYSGKDLKLRNRNLREGFEAKLHGHIPAHPAIQVTAIPRNGGHCCYCTFTLLLASIEPIVVVRPAHAFINRGTPSTCMRAVDSLARMNGLARLSHLKPASRCRCPL